LFNEEELIPQTNKNVLYIMDLKKDQFINGEVWFKEIIILLFINIILIFNIIKNDFELSFSPELNDVLLNRPSFFRVPKNLLNPQDYIDFSLNTYIKYMFIKPP